ncbi:unnamed protein product [Pleuronectes platessa]|uniref:Uncharacterized protein n=1 Tax=Pleuronectes platessa TaxID=8262 RepID=A0A9N7VIE6_PLEPL|nr:unnamed protein product [Pleuronectes platessa]
MPFIIKSNYRGKVRSLYLMQPSAYLPELDGAIADSRFCIRRHGTLIVTMARDLKSPCFFAASQHTVQQPFRQSGEAGGLAGLPGSSLLPLGILGGRLCSL